MIGERVNFKNISFAYWAMILGFFLSGVYKKYLGYDINWLTIEALWFSLGIYASASFVFKTIESTPSKSSSDSDYFTYLLALLATLLSFTLSFNI